MVGLQNKTMQMMYETIYKALEEVGLENSCSPQDYLNFYCLGNREAGKVEGNESPSAANTPQVLAMTSIILKKISKNSIYDMTVIPLYLFFEVSLYFHFIEFSFPFPNCAVARCFFLFLKYKI